VDRNGVADSNRVRLERLGAPRACVIERGLEERACDPLPARRRRHREAHDRPDRPVVDGRDDLRPNDPLEVGPWSEADPADRPIAVERHQPRRLIGFRLVMQPLAQPRHLQRREVLRAQPPELAPAPARIATLAKQRRQRIPGLAVERPDVEGPHDTNRGLWFR
jgi:hypothetical protein